MAKRKIALLALVCALGFGVGTTACGEEGDDPALTGASNPAVGGTTDDPGETATDTVPGAGATTDEDE